MRTIVGLASFVALGFATGCGPAHLPPEPTFQEHFGVSVELPIAEADFVELLNAESISHETALRMPSPRDPELAASRSLSHAITVYGDFDNRLGRQAGYNVYVDTTGAVVFIENRFAYVAVTGPCLFGICL